MTWYACETEENGTCPGTRRWTVNTTLTIGRQFVCYYERTLVSLIALYRLSTSGSRVVERGTTSVGTVARQGAYGGQNRSVFDDIVQIRMQHTIGVDAKV